MTDNNTYAAGWYPDANAPGTERYYDGTTWTTQSRPLATPSTTAVTTAEPVENPGKRPWYKRKAIIIPAAIIIGLIILANIIGAINGAGRDAVPAADTSSSAPAEVESSEPVESAEPEPEPEPEPVEEGTLTTPYPVGYVVSIYEGDPDNELATMSVAIKDGNAGAAIAQANQFNEPAQPGYHYVAVEYTMTGSSPTEPANLSYLLYDWSLAQTDGVLIGENNSSVVLPEGWNDTYDVNDLYQGQTGAAVVIYQVPDAYTGPLLATAYGKYLSL